MREQFRPYTLVADLVATTPSSITLTDSEGTALKSNYISVECSGGSNDFFSVILSGIEGVVAGTLSKDAANMVGTTSGVIGGTSRTGQGVVEFVLADRDRVSEITISQPTAAAARYFINYEQVWSGNALRDLERPKGN